MLSFLAVTISLVSFVSADVFLTAPVAVTSWKASAVEQVTWIESGVGTSLAKLGNINVDLYTGSQFEQTFLATLAIVDASEKKVAVAIKPTIGPSGAFYFLRVHSSNASASATDVFSAKFTLKDMTGTFNSTVLAQIAQGNSTSASASGTATTTIKATSTSTTLSRSTLGTSVPALSATASASNSSATSGSAFSGATPTGVSSLLVAFLAFAAAGLGAF